MTDCSTTEFGGKRGRFVMIDSMLHQCIAEACELGASEFSSDLTVPPTHNAQLKIISVLVPASQISLSSWGRDIFCF